MIWLVLCHNFYVFAFSGQWTDDRGALVPLVLTQNSEAELICPTNITMPNITFLKDGQPFLSRPVGKVC